MTAVQEFKLTFYLKRPKKNPVGSGTVGDGPNTIRMDCMPLNSVWRIMHGRRFFDFTRRAVSVILKRASRKIVE